MAAEETAVAACAASLPSIHEDEPRGCLSTRFLGRRCERYAVLGTHAAQKIPLLLSALGFLPLEVCFWTIII